LNFSLDIGCAVLVVTRTTETHESKRMTQVDTNSGLVSAFLLPCKFFFFGVFY